MQGQVRCTFYFYRTYYIDGETRRTNIKKSSKKFGLRQQWNNTGTITKLWKTVPGEVTGSFSSAQEAQPTLCSLEKEH